jgi:hypothetical protein
MKGNNDAVFNGKLEKISNGKEFYPRRRGG